MMRTIILALVAIALAVSPALAQTKKSTGPHTAPGIIPGTTVLCDPANLIPGCKQSDGSIFNGPTAASGDTNPLANLSEETIAKLLADFTYASARAHATGNTVTAPCWDMWVTLLTAQQSSLCGPLAAGAAAPANNSCPSGQAPLSKPDPHVVTDAEYLSEFINQLQPNSALSIACAPTLQASAKNISTLVGAVLSGGALGLFKLP